MTDKSPAESEMMHPIELFQGWMNDAKKSESEDPDAASLATCGAGGMPDARMILVRQADERGFVFYTNYESAKGQEILENPKAALCFHWKSLRRQIRIQGNIEKVSDTEADAYFNSRPRESRIGAWASIQSRPLDQYETLEKRVQEFEHKFNGIENPPRPPHWSGFRIIPIKIEFWEQQQFRLHKRTVYTKKENGIWTTTLLYP